MLGYLAISVGVTLVVWGLVWGRSLSRLQFVGLAALAMVVVLLAARPVQDAVLGGYPGDSFWDLGAGGRFGVLFISTVGLLLIFLLLAWKSRFFRGFPMGIGLAFDVLAGLLIYVLVFSMSPQIYYTLYQMIFPDLPAQIVVQHLVSPRLAEIVRLGHDGSMSDHLAGTALWAVLPFTLWVHSRKASA